MVDNLKDWRGKLCLVSYLPRFYRDSKKPQLQLRSWGF
jgi:hypothetical protein